MKKIRLTENDLVRIIEKVVKEDLGGMDDSHPKFGKMNFSEINFDDPDFDIEEYLSNEGFFGGDMEDDFEFQDSELAEMKRRFKRKNSINEEFGASVLFGGVVLMFIYEFLVTLKQLGISDKFKEDMDKLKKERYLNILKSTKERSVRNYIRLLKNGETNPKELEALFTAYEYLEKNIKNGKISSTKDVALFIRDVAPIIRKFDRFENLGKFQKILYNMVDSFLMKARTMGVEKDENLLILPIMILTNMRS